jgi:capsular exopolysaccharide synthesis family protein
MSRIQDILAKAERDGTARRTPATPTLVPPSAPTALVAPAPPVSGSSALDASRFAPVAAAPAAAVALTDVRTADATLHPALVAAIDPHAAVAEQYRALRTRLNSREDAAALRIIAITSPGSRDGKSVTAANLALTIAQEFQRSVLLIDGDLRSGAVHGLFGVEQGPGLSEVLSGEVTLDDALLHLPDHQLSLLPAGSPPDFPTELLGSSAMRRVLDTLRGRFDRIIIDLPSVMPLADVGTVAPLADGVLMVIRTGVTKRPALDEALATFDNGKVLGVVLNDAKR